jgi:hypothetical protein
MTNKMSVKIHSNIIDGDSYDIGYKVVTTDMKSLGLRKNPNILEFKLDEWYMLDDSNVEEGNGDWGGIWVARTLSNATKLQSYMHDKYNQDTRLFKTALDDILFVNSYRIKTKGVMLFEEL